MDKKEEPKKRLFLIEKIRGIEPPLMYVDRVERAIEVYACKFCGIIFTYRPGRLGQCPLGHDQ